VRKDLGRVITAMVTPFKENGEVNYEKAVELAEYLIENGSDGILVSGTTGESPVLSDEEKVKLFETIAEALNGKAVVIAGTGCNSTDKTIELTKRAETVGVDAVMLVGPYYNKPPQEGFYRHFEKVASSTNLPIMIYNVPGRTGKNIEAETTLRLAEIDNIVAIKEASGNLDQVSTIIANKPEDFEVYSGDDSLTLPILALGGKGVVSVASHIAGSQIREMILAYERGETQKASEIHAELFPLFKAMFVTTNPIPVKTAMNLLGWELGELKLPLTPPGSAELIKIKGVLKALGYNLTRT